MKLIAFVLPAVLFGIALSENILLTNDDGWAEAVERALFTAMDTAGYDIVLSAPAVDRSGTGSSTTTPTPRTSPCQYDSCPSGSPAVGFNASEPRFNYVNAFPVDAARYGIQTLSPQFFGGPPDLVVSGPNVGSNLGSTVLISGTVGAASEAALEGIPSLAFSSASGSHVSYTTLESSPDSTASRAARLYSQLTVTFVQAFLSSSARPLLPPGISVNINYPSITNCAQASLFKFVLSRINSGSGSDVLTCGSTSLPRESTVVATSGCYSSVSVFNASTKADVDATTQQAVLSRLSTFLTCLP